MKKRKCNLVYQVQCMKKTEFLLKSVQSYVITHVFFAISNYMMNKYVHTVMVYIFKLCIRQLLKHIRTRLRTLLSNMSFRDIRPNDAIKKNGLEQKKRFIEKTHKQVELMEADGSLPPEDIEDAERKILVPEEEDDYEPLSTQPAGTMPATRYSPTCSVRLCLCLPGLWCITSLYSRISCNVISVSLYFVNVSLTQ